MKNSFGQSLTVTLFGESHGPCIGATLDGIAPGINIDFDYINHCLDLRRPYGKISTTRKEPDTFEIISGEYNGYTTGTPLTLIIRNTNTHSSDYRELQFSPRPGHADYTAQCKYHGFQDPRGGGHFSGRITAPLVAVGALLRSALLNKGIKIGTHISYMCGVFDSAISSSSELDILNNTLFPVLNESIADVMKKSIEKAAENGDSVGGILETFVYGLPSGVGEPFFDSIESIISHMLFSVPGIKGVEFGAGFSVANMLGSECNDNFDIIDGEIVTTTNNNGGINGGISNGMPLIIRSAVKPTPSIFKPQQTVDLNEKCKKTLKIIGRHDPAIIHRVRAVVDSAIAIAIADLLTVRFGTDYLS